MVWWDMLLQGSGFWEFRVQYTGLQGVLCPGIWVLGLFGVRALRPCCLTFKLGLPRDADFLVALSLLLHCRLETSSCLHREVESARSLSL